MSVLPAILSAALLAAAGPSEIERLLESTPADSLARPLRQLEQRQGRTPEAGEVAFRLAQLHFARGEYRQAAETFARAAARLEPSRKSEARYWQGLCDLALKQPAGARATLEEVAIASGPRRADALLGLSYAWEQAGRPDRALDALERALAAGPSEVTPAVLERIAQFAPGLGRPDLARRAAERLRREYPHSVESARHPPPAPAAASGTAVAVQLGAFSDPERARALADGARRAGFSTVQVVERGRGEGRLFVVRLGTYPNREAAVRAADRASAALGVSARIEAAR